MQELDLSKPISGAKFAALVGVSRPAVSGMLKDGILSRGDTAGEWLASYIGHLREIAAGRADTPAAQHSRERILAAEATRREELARMASLKRQQQVGELIAADDLDAVLGAACGVAKREIWNWQGRLPPMLAGQTAAAVSVALGREAHTLFVDMEDNFGPRAVQVAKWLAKNAPETLWRFQKPLQKRGRHEH